MTRQRRRHLRDVTFCERCAEVCDTTCRRRAVRERHQVAALQLGPWR